MAACMNACVAPLLGGPQGAGVEWLLEYMGVPAAHIMAMGDGENDVEMLQLAGVRH